jgi:hypothetical protein
MYENQRGTTLFGKSWYSSNTLLPSDPTPFTLCSKLPATEVTETRTPAGTRQQKKSKPKLVRDTINTPYNLQTYQTPSPAWVWLTPWMVNMRTQTDEQGWEYNLWFHRASWRSHPGHLNWWGWVRRREWVRLRSLVPEIIEKANEEVREAVDDFWGRGRSRHSSERSSRRESRIGLESERDELGERSAQEAEAAMDWDGGDAVEYAVRDLTVADDRAAAASTKHKVENDRTSTTTDASSSSSAAASNPADVSLALLLDSPHPVLEMVRLLALAPLDREKLAALLRWIDDGSAADVDELKRLLEDHGNVS